MRGTEFAELTAFISIADQGSFAKAARQLDIAPSTLSQTIRLLEDRLGVRLLHRTTRNVSLTEAGERLLTRIRPAFAEVQNAVEATRDFRDTPSGVLRLSVSSVPARLILAPLLRGFMEAYPAISLDIVVDNSTNDIVTGRFDAGIRYGRLITRDMQLVRVSPPWRLITVASPDYLARFGVPRVPQDLHEHRCIGIRLGQQPPLHWEFEKQKRKIEMVTHDQLIVNDVDLAVQAARDGAGICYMLESYLAPDIEAGRLVQVLADWAIPPHSYYLYHANRHQLPTPLRLFIAYLTERLPA